MKVTAIKKFTVGSGAFFKNIPSFKNDHDEDTVHILDYPLFGNRIYVMRHDNKDDFLLYNFGKDKLIELCNDPLQVGKFLVPEFAEYINMTIDDLTKLKPMLDKIDEKHSYEKLIYNYYIENNEFSLTDEQLNAVYEEYTKYR